MPVKIQGLIVLIVGSLLLFVSGAGSIALATGAATGPPYPFYIAGYALIMTIIGWIGFKELHPEFNAVSWTAGLLVASIIAITIARRI